MMVAPVTMLVPMLMVLMVAISVVTVMSAVAGQNRLHVAAHVHDHPRGVVSHDVEELALKVQLVPDLSRRIFSRSVEVHLPGPPTVTAAVLLPADDRARPRGEEVPDRIVTVGPGSRLPGLLPP